MRVFYAILAQDISQEETGIMPTDLTNETVSRIRGWLGAHVEATVLHAAINLHLLPSLLNGAQSSIELAEKQNYEQYSTRVIMDILAGLGVVTKDANGNYDIGDAFRTALIPEILEEVAVASQKWQDLSPFSTTMYDQLLKSAQAASSRENSNQAQLLEYAWKYVWSVGIMELGEHHLFTLLDEHPLPLSELATQHQLSEGMLAQLCLVGQHTGLFSLHDGQVELTQEARRAFGKGSMKEYCRWMEQRVKMERQFFYTPLGMLSQCVRDRQPASLSSSLGTPANSQFRRTFIRINRPMIPLLYRVAQKVTSAMDIAQQPIRVLEIGAALGCWGIALASAHQQNQIVAVDTPEALGETQHIVAAAKVGGQYTWVPSDMHHIEPEHGPYDVIVLNEVCHTVSPTALATWLEHILQFLSPHGTLLIADMVLDENRTAPFRHLLSAAKLLATGGGHILSITDYQQMLHRLGLASVQLHRLATTDLIVASPHADFSLAL